MLTMIGTPAIAFGGNLGFLQLVLGYLIARVILCLVLIPHYFQGEFYTAYQLLGKRFGARMKSAGAVQLARYLSGSAAAFILLAQNSRPVDQRDPTIRGGWKVAGVRFHADPDANLYLLVRDSGWCIPDHGEPRDGQTMVQRLFAARNERDSKTALLASGVIVFVPFTKFLVIGVLRFVYTQHSAFPVPAGDADRIFPEFMVREMPRGLAGIVLASIFAVAMSNASGSLNSLASSSIIDLRTWRGPGRC